MGQIKQEQKEHDDGSLNDEGNGGEGRRDNGKKNNERKDQKVAKEASGSQIHHSALSPSSQ